ADRVALVVGTSTASIGATEQAYRELEDGRFAARLRNPRLHTPHSLGLFLQAVLGTRGPCLTVATACSSSAKIFAQAERLLRLGQADAAILAGVDTLCGSVLFGFNALELVSPEACRPFDTARNGISIGEAAGFALLERDGGAAAPHLLGYGESSDAHHMSTPHPQGLGARLALADALARADLAPADVDYINFHGTATLKNDEVEAALIAEVFAATTRASSTKGFTGHTLGAAGILEAVLTLLAMEQELVPGTLNTTTPDAVCGPQLALANEERAIRVALSNSFGFGGNNCTLAFGRGRAH
ncbi:MAG: beta-ketoacyl synthase N-terminal-like domain-containing protein, partial [Lysobacterales bacterium]